jgi:hypothetical protein
MNQTQRCFLVFTMLLCCACDSRPEKSNQTQTQTRPNEVSANAVLTKKTLAGTWVSEVVKSEIGLLVVSIIFLNNETFSYRLVVLDQSPPGERHISGTFKLKDDRIVLHFEGPQGMSQSIIARMSQGDLWMRVGSESTNDFTEEFDQSVGPEYRFRRMGD